MTGTPPRYLPTPTCSEAYAIGIYIPPHLLSIERTVGVEPLRAFLEEWGGREFGIPTTVTADTPHAEVVDALRAQFGPGRFMIAVGPLGSNVRVAWSVYLGLKNGMSLTEIARQCGCHARTVSGHKKRLMDRGLLSATEASTPKGTAK